MLEKFCRKKTQTGNTIIAGNAVNFLVMAEMARQDYLRKKGVKPINGRKGKHEGSEQGRFGNSNKDTISASDVTAPQSEKTTGTKHQNGDRNDGAARNYITQNGQHFTETKASNKHNVDNKMSNQ
jgi:hypothetical protein